MSEDNALSTAVPQFQSYRELFAEHRGLMQLIRAKDSDERAVEQINRFLHAAQKTGRILSDPDERVKAQDIIFEWVARLNYIGNAPVVAVPELAQYEPAFDSGKDKVSSDQAGGIESISKNNQPEPPGKDSIHKVIRFVGLARQWLANDKDPGYLLSGKALEEAKQFIKNDPDIAVFVTASEQHEKEETQKTITKYRERAGIFGILLLFAILAAGFGVYMWSGAETARSKEKYAKDKAVLAAKKEKDAADSAKASKEAADIARGYATVAAGEAEAKQKLAESYSTQLAVKTKELEAETLKVKEALADAQRQLEALEVSNQQVSANNSANFKTQAELNTAITDIDRLIKSGRLNESDLSPEFSDVLKKVQVDEVPPLPPERSQINPVTEAYRQDFLYGGTTKSNLWVTLPIAGLPDQHTLNYEGYSLLYDKSRRIARLAASNLDRSALPPVILTLPPITTDPDIGLENPDWQQWLADTNVVVQPLVEWRDISWRAGLFDIGREKKGDVGFDVVFAPNHIPMSKWLAVGLWKQLSDYTLFNYETGTAKISQMAGPVLPPNSNELPHLFWKIIVSGSSSLTPRLQAEAYLLPDQPVSGFEDIFSFRVPVSEIERLTGIDLGANLRLADTFSQPGLSWSEQLSIDQPEAAAKLGMPTLEGDVSAVVWKRHLDMRLAADPTRLPEALSVVPAELWQRPEFIDLRARARLAVVGNASSPEQENLKPNLGFPLAKGWTVYVQTSGTKGSGEEIRSKLSKLGWSLPAIEVVAAAPAIPEVRYRSDQSGSAKAGAELLAADLRALGVSGAQAKHVSIIGPANFEVWIGR